MVWEDRNGLPHCRINKNVLVRIRFIFPYSSTKAFATGYLELLTQDGWKTLDVHTEMRVGDTLNRLKGYAEYLYEGTV